MYLAIVNSAGATQYTFPETIYVDNRSFSQRSRTSNIPYRDGGREIGDQMQSERILTLYGQLYADTNDELRDDINDLNEILMEGDYKLYLDERYINIDTLVKFDENYVKGADMKVVDTSMSFKATDPNFYAGESTLYYSLTGSSETLFSVDNTGSKITFPYIGISAAAVTYFKLTNTTTGQCFIVDYPAGASLITVDSKEGEVYIDGTADGSTYMSGSFIRYDRDSNTLLVYADAVTATISFTFNPTYSS